uniref:RING-type domain-containing protein n=1 Tax=Meloidogyne enterolobii TaxID=390850 RepID=A0A6V7UIG6_MELEN|nr:unnamed protein product [Meloidogyne enterolobii]
MAYTRRTANFEKNETFKNSENSSSTAGTSQKPMENFVSLSSINPYITCPLCNGYFVDATTVIDCLHTFCKSCLLKYFDEDNTDCPKCHYQIHQSHPSHYVAFDRTMQDIVYKLVPGMQKNNVEENNLSLNKRKKKIRNVGNRKKNGSFEKDENGGELASNESSETSKSNEEENKGKEVPTKDDDECCSSEQDPSLMHRRNDEPVLIRLIPDSKLDPIDRSFVRLSAFATINTVKRLLAYLLFADITKYNEFDIFCNYELMGRDFSMAFIRKTRWRNKPEPVVLMYKERLDF